ncbi:hypothetical protein [Methanosarcina sp. 2.H.A.1B.4]|uniref:hypothetical protein n=1 Tax=Methanosarcina sp. 2.H.A.1B.4 TaxID=1483600 RepID=UPI000ADF4237|nr:hypothetical protein [Methanosarcina sp. 2.H.A.1B.4]
MGILLIGLAVKEKGLFVVSCGYSQKTQRDLELKIILSIENDEEPEKETVKRNSEKKK